MSDWFPARTTTTIDMTLLVMLVPHHGEGGGGGGDTEPGLGEVRLLVFPTALKLQQLVAGEGNSGDSNDKVNVPPKVRTVCDVVEQASARI